MIQPGDTLANRYEIKSKLGEGGMATVFECVDHELQQRMAIKVLHEHLRIDKPESVERFLLEARLMEKLSEAPGHPDVISIYNLIQRPDLVAITMPLIPEGLELDVFLKRDGAMEERAAIDMMVQILDGMEYIHGHNILHRDLKPPNILLTRDERGGLRPLIADFGIACERGDEGMELHGSDEEEGALGSPPYMAPELFDAASNASPSSDVYALGALLFEMIAGVPAFEVESLPTHIMRVSAQPPPSLLALRPEVSPWLDHAIEAAMARDAAERFLSAASFRDVLLEEAIDGAMGERDPTLIASDYKVRARIGRGPVGNVYECVDINLNVPVAVKLLRGAEPGRQARFIEEARAQSQLHQGRSHPGIVAIRHVIAQGLWRGMVLGWVKGMSLDRFLKEQGPQSLPEIVRIFTDVADALAFGHSKGVVHGNLKPSNLLIAIHKDTPPQAKLTDFGMATIKAGPLAERAKLEGTLPYIAPEHAERQERRRENTESKSKSELEGEGEGGDKRDGDGDKEKGDKIFAAGVSADIFGFGTLLLHTLIGERPPAVLGAGSRGANSTGGLNAAQRAIPPLPQALSLLLHSCLSSDPQERPKSAKELGELLLISLNEEVVSKNSKGSGMLIAGLLLVLVIGVIGWLLLSEKPPALAPPASSAPTMSPEEFSAQLGTLISTHAQEIAEVCVNKLLEDPTRRTQAERLGLKQVTIKLRVSLDADGKLQTAEIVEDPLGEVGVGSCIATLAQSWNYPATGKEQRVTIPWPLDLQSIFTRKAAPTPPPPVGMSDEEFTKEMLALMSAQRETIKSACLDLNPKKKRTAKKKLGEREALIKFEVSLAKDGKLGALKVLQDDLPELEISACLHEQVKSWSFPIPGKERIFELPFPIAL